MIQHSAAATRRAPVDLPSEAVEDTPLTTDAAAAILDRFGFVAFRTASGSPRAEWCLMAVLREEPTHGPFDPEAVTYWTTEDGHGRLASIEGSSPLPISGRMSWGRIEMRGSDGGRASFVTFGGHVRAERLGPDAVLVTLSSSAPILRLSGRNQRQDELAQEVVGFFARLLPRLWDSPAMERRLAQIPPEVLWSAFLLHESERLDGSSRGMQGWSSATRRVRRAVIDLAGERPEATAAGRGVLADLGLLGRR